MGDNEIIIQVGNLRTQKIVSTETTGVKDHWRIEGGANGALPPPPLKLVKV